jgi:hypothetical protein
MQRGDLEITSISLLPVREYKCVVVFRLHRKRKKKFGPLSKRCLTHLGSPANFGDMSFATVWRVADRAGIELKAGREAKGYKRLPADRWRKIAETLAANPEATQEEVARATGVSRSTVGRLVRARTRGTGLLL